MTGVPVARVLEALGVAAELVVPARGQALVTGPRLYDGEDPSSLGPGDLVLGVGVQDTGRLLADAAAAGVAAVAVRPGRGALGGPVPVLTVAPELTWDQVFRVVSVLTSRPEAGDGSPVRDLFALADAIAALVGGAVTIEDSRSTLLAYSSLDQPIDEPRRQTILGRGHGLDWAARLEAAGALTPLVETPGSVVKVVDPEGQVRTRLAASVGAGGELLGFVWAVEGTRPFTEQDEAALAGCLALAAVHLLSHRAAGDGLRQQQGLALRDVLLGTQSPEVLAEAMGVRQDASCLVAAFRLGADDDVDLAVGRAKAVDLITVAAEAFRRRVVCCWIDRTVYALFPAVDSTSVGRLVGLCRGITEQARSALGIVVTAGVGAVVPLEDVRRSRGDADRTVRVLAARSVAAGHIDEVRVGAVLVALADLLSDRPELRLPGVEQLRAGGRHAAEQLAVLRAFALAGGSTPATAEGLGLHVNTVRYRLKRAGEITGLDLADPETRFVLALQFYASDESAAS